MTWNVNGRDPPSSLVDMLLDYGVEGYASEELPPDIYAIGLVHV